MGFTTELTIYVCMACVGPQHSGMYNWEYDEVSARGAAVGCMTWLKQSGLAWVAEDE